MPNFISPLRYPGGKSRAAKVIVSLFPNHIEYREPFFGGGSVFFESRTRFQKKTYWINDLNKDLVIFWKAARDHNNDIVREIVDLKAKFKEDGFSLYRYLKNEYILDTDVKVAVRFFILNRITFSGLTDSGGFSKESFELRFNKSSIEKLIRVPIFLENVRITNLDYSSLLSIPGSEVFIFLDPPYFSQRKSKLYGKNGDLHTNFDHSKLADELLKCNHRWMITYDDDEYIRELYRGCKIKSWNLQYGMNQKNGTASKGNEVIITN